MLPTRFMSRTSIVSAQRLFSSSQARFEDTANGGKKKTTKKAKAAKAEKEPAEVPLTPPSKPSWDNTKYSVKEYYSHNNMTFFDLDVEMESKRLPQPSSLKH